MALVTSAAVSKIDLAGHVINARGPQGFDCQKWSSSLRNLCVLCVSVVKVEFTTEAQRTQRLHRDG